MKILFSLLLAFMAFDRAHALVFIEPMLGYSTGKLETKTNDNAPFKFDLAGIGFGARAGVSLGGLQLGLDHMQNNYTVKLAAANYSDKLSLSETGLFVGYRLMFFRLYGTYIFSGNDDGEGEKMKFDSGLKLGATFYALSHLAISLEMRQAQYKELIDSDGDRINAKYNTMALVVSFPFEL